MLRTDFTCVEEFLPFAEPLTWEDNCAQTRLKDGRSCVLKRLSENSLPYRMLIRDDPCHQTLCIRKSSNELPLSMHKVFNELGMESFFLQFDSLILHSSLIRWEKKAILFSAPSGTGKSTQADLWARYQGAEILNGDRSILRKMEQGWTAFGLPFAGSSDIFRNESAPVRCIVMLEQASENHICRLSPRQALMRIYPEFTLHRWDEAFLNKGLAIILDILEQVPVYLLSCRPDREAVETLRHTLIQEV